MGGSLQHGSELVLEVAEARLRNVNLDGSLLVCGETQEFAAWVWAWTSGAGQRY